MRVFVSGATGVLGRRTVAELSERDHEVVGLVRDEAGAESVDARGGVPVHGDVIEPGSFDDVADDGVDVVVHAATALPTASKPSEADWTQNDQVRLEGARNLLDVFGDDVSQFLFPSVSWIARQPDGSSFDEDAPLHPTRATRSAARVEDLVSAAGEEHDFDATVLRFGFFYAPDADHTRQFGEGLLARRLPVVGGGPLGRRDAAVSLVHADDAGRAVADAVVARADGLFHVVDEEPVTIADLFTHFADRLDAPSPRRVPGWLVRLIVGRETVAMMTNPAPTTADRFEDATGWEPRYPTYRDGIEQVVGSWLDTGTLRQTDDGYEWAGD